MHIRGWTILGICACTLLLLLYALRIIQEIRARIVRLDLASDKAAHAEALSAHSRIDRLDADLKADWKEIGLLRMMISAVKGQVKFLLHKDISEELSRQSDAAKKGKANDDDRN